MDYGYKLTEKELKELEKRITKEYETAEKEVQGKLFDYLQNFKSKDADMQAQMESGKISQTEYNNWRVNQMATGKRWENMRQSLAEDFHNTNNIAKEMTKEHSYDIYALNHNYGTYEIEKGAKVDTSYTLYNRATVERLVRDNPQMLPPPGKKVAERIRQGKDVLWNNQQIQSVMVQGLLQGMSIPELAERLAETVGDKDKVGAIRNARTMTTGAQNAGRVDSYKRAVDMGIKTKQRWIAVLDEKTRHSHRQLDGEMVDVGEKFSNGCRFPGDPSGAPEEVYNCRCAVVSAIEGTALAGNIEDLPRLSKIGDYEEWKKGKAPEEKAQEEKAKETTKTNDIKPFDSTKDMTNFEIDNSIDWYNSLPESEKDALYNYSFISAPVNDFLRGDDSIDQSEQVAEIDKAISRNELKQSVEIYRGVGTDYLGLDLSSEESIRSLIGETITDPAFLSTTLSEKVAQTYSRGIVLKIDAEEGENVAFIDTVYNQGSEEKMMSMSDSGDSNHELLFGRNMGLTFYDYEKKEDQYGNSYYEIMATMKSPKDEEKPEEKTEEEKKKKKRKG